MRAPKMQNPTATLGELSDPQEDERVKANESILYEYFRKDLVYEINHMFDILDDNYFRSKFVGFDHFPERNIPEKPLIVISNHSGMAFPWDGMIFASRFFKRENYGPNAVRPLIAPMLTQTVLMNPFMIPNIWKTVGAIDASSLNFETMMRQHEYNILIYPEGVPGIGKGFNNRYQLQRFATSYLRMSLKHKTDVIPFYTINGEFVNPYSYKAEWLNKLVSKIGIPFLPIAFHTLLILVQPWLFYYALPARLTYVLGKRISPYKMINKPFEEITLQELHELNEKIRIAMQAEIDQAVAEYGQKPYQWKSFFKNFGKKMKLFPFFLPFGWPLLFAEFERKKLKGKNDGKPFTISYKVFFKALLRNPIIICYFLPIIGWVPLLIKGYNKKALHKK